ncbi:MAG TPA: aminotransferase class V-fold PLP-dependent enzyme [Rhodocyclaceae bacterium]
MPGLLPNVDPDGHLEFSVVYTDRALNHMSKRFQGVMTELSRILKTTYGAQACAVVPGGGTYGMEAIARQFATGRRCLVIRNGWFSYRWTQILDAGKIPSATTVLKARQTSPEPTAPFAPVAVEAVVATILAEKPDLVFAPHVETASGILLPDDYLKQIAQAVHSYGGLFVLDCIASGAVWVDMKGCGVDILVSAPQKGWSGSPGAAFVMLGETARKAIDATTSSSFACDLKKWLQIMETYENGGHAYHATMPTDALKLSCAAMLETEQMGLAAARDAQEALGRAVRSLLAQRGYPSVAAAGFEAPGVVVSYTSDPEIQSGRKFLGLGLQTAAGVPLMCDEGESFRSFRIGLFGLDKLRDVPATVARLADALDRIRGKAS